MWALNLADLKPLYLLLLRCISLSISNRVEYFHSLFIHLTFEQLLLLLLLINTDTIHLSLPLILRSTNFCKRVYLVITCLLQLFQINLGAIIHYDLLFAFVMCLCQLDFQLITSHFVLHDFLLQKCLVILEFSNFESLLFHHLWLHVAELLDVHAVRAVVIELDL